MMMPTGPSPRCTGMRTSSCRAAMIMGSEKTSVLPAGGRSGATKQSTKGGGQQAEAAKQGQEGRRAEQFGRQTASVATAWSSGQPANPKAPPLALPPSLAQPHPPRASLPPSRPPDPVKAMPMMSLPARMAGVPCIWMGVGFLMPFVSRVFRMAGGNFMSGKLGMGGGRWVP